MSTVLIDNTITHYCPACNGLMLSEAITITPWRMDYRGRHPIERRTVTMTCPHCDRVFTRRERRYISRQ